MYQIKTSANFEAAHRLSKYDGKCNRLHGHNWKVELEAESKSLDDQEMVLDFTKLKTVLKEFDHMTILTKNKENELIAKSLPKEWIKWIDFEPTAEQIAKYLANKLFNESKIDSITITVWENEKSNSKFTKTR